MDIITNTFEMSRIGRRVTKQFLLDEDLNVPDAKLDVRKIILSEGTLKIDEVKTIDNYLRLIGKMEYRILYAAEDPETAFSNIEGKIPFEELIYTDAEEEGVWELKSCKADLRVSMIHSRKLRLKTVAEVEAELVSCVREEIPIDVEREQGIYKKRETLELLKLHTSKRDTFRIKEEVTVSGMKESIGNLLWTEVENYKFDARLGEDQLSFQGELQVFVFYESPEGKWDWMTQTIPYQGMVECFGVNETMFHQVEAGLEDLQVDVRLDEDGEARVLGIEGTLRLKMLVYEEESMEILKDVYSTEQNCILEYREAACETLLLQNRSKCKVMERLSLPELRGEILQICHSCGTVRVEQMEKKEDGILIRGILYLRFLYVRSKDEIPFDSWQGMLPFSFLVECPAEKDMNYQIHTMIEQCAVSLQGGDEVEVKATLAFQGFFSRMDEREVIAQARLEPVSQEELAHQPSMIGYIVRDGDDLWSLAKKYRTSEKEIQEVNEITGNQIKAGDRLLIFCEKESIL